MAKELQKVEGKKFYGEDVHVDGKLFIGCSFDSCALVYSGGELPKWEECGFTGDPQFHLEESAARTLQMIQSLAGFTFYAAGIKAQLEEIIRKPENWGRVLN